jgi:5-oxoprolinase (ATP-hydrolysing)
VTDVNLYLGRIVAERFPFPLDRNAVNQRLDALSQEIAAATGKKMSRLELAEGFVRVANANMAKALRSISVAKGCDPSEYLLVPFGGAAGQHACALATELGMREILFHPDAGLLSALGAGLADHAAQRSAPVYRRLDEMTADELSHVFATLQQNVRHDLYADLPYEHELAERTIIRRALDLRYVGVEAPITIPEPADKDFAAAFTREHEKRYGYLQPTRAIEVVTARVEAVLHSTTELDHSGRITGNFVASKHSQTAYFDGHLQSVAVFYDDEISPGDRITGPAIVVQRHSTVVLEPEWQAQVMSSDEILATPVACENDPKLQRALPTSVDLHDADTVQLEIFNNQFAGIAEQMGIALRNTAVSVNVKERLDFSCAIFTLRGELVANAPHVPVHLGAMGETVRRTIDDNRAIRPGDVFVSNDPYRGGSHLPDVTVITPVFDASAGRQPLFFTASRAHHAEIGGITPGSMPPFSKNLAEEGVLIRNFKLLDAGRPRFDELRAILTSGPYPSRAVEDNLADITAQVAANRRGALELLALVARFGQPTITAYMRHLQRAAEQKARRALRRLDIARGDSGAVGRLLVLGRVEQTRGQGGLDGTHDAVVQRNLLVDERPQHVKNGRLGDRRVGVQIG